MSKEIKTLKEWYEFTERTGNGSIYHYLNKGDIVSEDIIDYFLDILPPRSLSYNFLQVGEPYSHVYDISHCLRPTFMTFAKHDGAWKFYGHCYANETVNRD